MTTTITHIINALGEDRLAALGREAGLDRDQSLRAARALCACRENAHGAVVAGVVAETGLSAQQVESVLAKVLAASAGGASLGDKTAGKKSGGMFQKVSSLFRK